MARKPLSNETFNIINLVDTHLQWKNLNGPPRDFEVYHPSAFGSCLRRMQYQRYEEMGLLSCDKKKVSSSMLRIWDTGNTLHDRWVRYFEEIGVLRGVWRCKNVTCHLYDDNGNMKVPDFLSEHENNGHANRPRIYGREDKIGIFKPDKCFCGCTEFEYNEVTVKVPEFNFRGHVDQILDFSKFNPDRYKEGNKVPILFKTNELPKNPIVLDMKSINSMGFRKKLEYDSPFVYKVQVTIYVHCLDLDYGILIYENKDNSEIKLDQIDRNEKWWNQICEQSKQMGEMISSKKLPPPRPTSKTSTDCKYCEFKSICHGGKKQSIWENENLDKLRKQFYGDLLE